MFSLDRRPSPVAFDVHFKDGRVVNQAVERDVVAALHDGGRNLHAVLVSMPLTDLRAVRFTRLTVIALYCRPALRTMSLLVLHPKS
jgi:hypothetical protein